MNSQVDMHTPSLISEKGEVCLETPLVRTLLVDDFEPFRALVSTMILKQSRFEIVGEAADGLTAIQKAEELKPDLILLDLDLPQLNGIEVARRVRKVSPNSTILFLSAATFPDLARAALGTGAAGYVAKFDVADELLRAIEAVLRGEQFISRRIRELGMAEDSSN